MHIHHIVYILRALLRERDAEGIDAEGIKEKIQGQAHAAARCFLLFFGSLFPPLEKGEQFRQIEGIGRCW